MVDMRPSLVMDIAPVILQDIGHQRNPAARKGPAMRMLFIAFTLALCIIRTAAADDTLRLAVGQRGLWDTAVAELGQRGGIFRKHGLTLDIFYTQGAAETQQAVISASVDIGVSPGAPGVFGAFAKGAPLRIIGSEIIGGGDLFWYVPAASPVNTLRDTDGRTIAYSTSGSASHSIVLTFISEYGLKARPVATGGPPATLTQVMSGQIDVGWAGPPFGLDLVDQGRIRIIATGNDAGALKNQTGRVILAHAAVLQARQPVVTRFMQAYRETIDWMYTDPVVFRHYADFMGIGEDTMRRARDRFYPKAVLDPDVILAIDAINAEAVRLHYMAAPLTPSQLAELIRIPPR
jgi:NitT/TauT family transport system substrate-binding protein